MAFFKQFPTQSYDFNMDGVLQNVVDIYRSVRVEGSSMDNACLLYTSPSPRDRTRSRMPSSA